MTALAKSPLSVTELAEATGMEKCGGLTKHLEQLSAAPFRQQATLRKKGCQVDLLLQTEGAVCIVEIKRMKDIGTAIESEIREKSSRLAVKRGISIRTALVYDGALSPRLEASAYIDNIVEFGSLFR